MSRNGCAPVRWISLSCPSTCREEFNLTELFREPLLCIVPQDWPEPQDDVMTPALMNGQSFVVQCDAPTPRCASSSRNTKSAPSAAATSSTTSPISPWWRPGLVSTIMPQMLLRDCKAAIKVYPIEPEEYRVVGLACSARPPWLRRGADVPSSWSTA